MQDDLHPVIMMLLDREFLYDSIGISNELRNLGKIEIANKMDYYIHYTIQLIKMRERYFITRDGYFINLN